MKQQKKLYKMKKAIIWRRLIVHKSQTAQFTIHSKSIQADFHPQFVFTAQHNLSTMKHSHVVTSRCLTVSHNEST